MIAGGARGSWIGAIAGALIGDWLEKRYFTRRMARTSARMSDGTVFEDDPVSSAYTLLGVRPDAPYEVVHAAYRELAKKYHPDSLKAAGVPPAEIRAAGAKMAKVNEAWKLIRSSRRSAPL